MVVWMEDLSDYRETEKNVYHDQRVAHDVKPNPN